MEIKNYLSDERVIFGIKATSKEDIIKELASYFLNDNTVIEKQDFDTLLEALYERENLSSTGMQDGIAIPHAKSTVVKKVAMLVAIDKQGKDFASLDDEKSKVFFLVVAPEATKREHLDILTTISKLSFEEEKLNNIINTNDAKEVIKILESL
ncbi:PTS sugar transporter subunit IIA [Sneathia sanguinegens]|uniref:PTS sugar transporter subunit IIA n=1 Tax=Sneathia sanguinegens TaxID=40543 RepID=A0ABT7HK30_9FUSO|nr:PTS sugar transporter subunit IIA [Sneathia sanguinegens]MDK9580392.1 PTS sugar transporter subunit IIA [Sneathia sanguinegens]MDU4652440.1 PTS sugar transporter subunit IIA [Sneathia sanguinegens]